MYEQYGPYFHHNLTSRALIFDRDQHKVKDMLSMQEMMRSQDLYNEPYSKCSAIALQCEPDYSGRLMVASRQDLSPKDGVYPIEKLAHADHGALDCKITNSEYIKELGMRVISSPPYEILPAFN